MPRGQVISASIWPSVYRRRTVAFMGTWSYFYPVESVYTRCGGFGFMQQSIEFMAGMAAYQPPGNALVFKEWHVQAC